MSSAVAHDLVQMGLVGEALEAGPVAVFVADHDMRYLAVNEYACRLLGYTREELLSLSVLDVAVNPEAGRDYEEMLVNGFRTGTARLQHKNGEEIAIEYRARQTVVGRMELFVSACWPVSE